MKKPSTFSKVMIRLFWALIFIALILAIASLIRLIIL